MVRYLASRLEVYHNSLLTSSETCRRRKLKFDETKPVCGQCKRARKRCIPHRNSIFRHYRVLRSLTAPVSNVLETPAHDEVAGDTSISGDAYAGTARGSTHYLRPYKWETLKTIDLAYDYLLVTFVPMTPPCLDEPVTGTDMESYCEPSNDVLTGVDIQDLSDAVTQTEETSVTTPHSSTPMQHYATTDIFKTHPASFDALAVDPITIC